MTVFERLKLELANKEYLTDNEYKVFLEENDLSATDCNFRLESRMSTVK
jgi:hypothetical protein